MVSKNIQNLLFHTWYLTWPTSAAVYQTRQRTAYRHRHLQNRIPRTPTSTTEVMNIVTSGDVYQTRQRTAYPHRHLQNRIPRTPTSTTEVMNIVTSGDVYQTRQRTAYPHRHLQNRIPRTPTSTTEVMNIVTSGDVYQTRQRTAYPHRHLQNRIPRTPTSTTEVIMIIFEAKMCVFWSSLHVHVYHNIINMCILIILSQYYSSFSHTFLHWHTCNECKKSFNLWSNLKQFTMIHEVLHVGPKNNLPVKTQFLCNFFFQVGTCLLVLCLEQHVQHRSKWSFHLSRQADLHVQVCYWHRLYAERFLHAYFLMSHTSYHLLPLTAVGERHRI